MSKPALIYEVNLEIDPHIAEEFDEWLHEHIEAMLDFDGFEAAEILDDEEKTRDGRVKRCTRYHVRDREALDEYLKNHARGMRAAGVEKFGAQFTAERRTLEVDTYLDADALGELSECMNCSGPLSGQYCSNCGQRSRVRLITMWELFRDLFADLFEFDSRVWRSIIPLLFRPGKLTREYLSGRRMRYVPPFRMYLILSIVFFLVSTYGADLNFEDVVINGDSQDFEEAVAELEKDIDEADDPGEIAALQKVLDGVLTAQKIAEGHADKTGDDSTAEEPQEKPQKEANTDEETGQHGFAITVDDDDEVDSFLEGCETWNITIINQQITEKLGGQERLRAACRKMAADNFSSFAQALLDNLPTMMFFFLPLLALVMKFLYLFSKRYYVEHLLFFVHYHAFFFLLLTLVILVTRLASRVDAQETFKNFLIVVVIIYTPIYLYKAMRRVYGQGHIATLFKFVILNISYIVSLLTMLTMTATFTALTL